MYTPKQASATPSGSAVTGNPFEKHLYSFKTQDQSADWSDIKVCGAQILSVRQLQAHTNPNKFLAAVRTSELFRTSLRYTSDLNLSSIEQKVSASCSKPQDRAFGCSQLRVQSVKHCDVLGDEDSSIVPESIDSTPDGKPPAQGSTDRSDFTFGLPTRRSLTSGTLHASQLSSELGS